MKELFSHHATRISIHALREEGDAVIHDGKNDFLHISIHALREEGDKTSPGHVPAFRYFYPRPPRGGRRQVTHRRRGRAGISIHALREEGDALLRLSVTLKLLFLSTPSARRATCSLP